MVQILDSNRNRVNLLNHLLMSLHPATKGSIIIGVHNPIDLDAPSPKALWHKEVTTLLHVLGVVEPPRKVSLGPERLIPMWKIGLLCERVSKENSSKW